MDIQKFDIKNRHVTVQGGIILDKDEQRDWSAWNNGLCKQINKRGWALSDLGSVVRETEAGFTVKQFISQPINLNCKYLHTPLFFCVLRFLIVLFLLFVSVCLMHAMGCSAGTTQCDYFDNAYSIRFVAGNCQIHTLTRDDYDFNAAIVCFGLFGIVTEITYQCQIIILFKEVRYR